MMMCVTDIYLEKKNMNKISIYWCRVRKFGWVVSDVSSFDYILIFISKKHTL